jgi:hypothetical protein
MTPEILHYSGPEYGANFLAVIKNGLVIDIACSSKNYGLYSWESRIPKKDWVKYTKVRARDLALYTHWPVHTKAFWSLLNEP